MALTPDVVNGAVIAPSWGNEVRDRTLQVFPSQGYVGAWNAPDGAHAVSLDTGKLWLRRGGGWRQRTWVLGGTYAGTTDANGQISFAHGFGETPTWAVFTPTEFAEDKIGHHVVVSLSSTNIRIGFRDALSGNLGSGWTLSGYWCAGL